MGEFVCFYVLGVLKLKFDTPQYKTLRLQN